MRGFCVFLLGSALIIATGCKSSTDDVCREPAVDLPCTSGSCLPLRATTLDSCVSQAGTDFSKLPVANGGTFLFSARDGSTFLLDRDGRAHTESAPPLAIQRVALDGDEPVVFGTIDPTVVRHSPDGVNTMIDYRPRVLTAAIHQGDGWLSEPLVFPEGPFRWDGVSQAEYFDPGSVQRVVAAKDGTLYALVDKARQLDGPPPPFVIATRSPTGPWAVLTSGPADVPTDVDVSASQSLFVDSQGRLGIVLVKQETGAVAHIFGAPSLDRALGPASSDYTFLPDPDRWFALIDMSGVPTWKLHKVDANGVSDVSVPAKAYPGITGCNTGSSSYPNASCLGRCHHVGAAVADMSLTVTSDGQTWVAYLETEADFVDDDEPMPLDITGQTFVCVAKLLSGTSTKTLVVSRVDEGGETVRGRWSLPSDRSWLTSGFVQSAPGKEIQIFLTGVTKTTPHTSDTLRVSIDTD